MAIGRGVARDWVSRAGDREGLRELLRPFINEPVDAAVFNRWLDGAVNVPAAVLGCTLQECISTSFADPVELLQMPTLVVGGRHDPIVTPEAVGHVARSLPCARGILSGVQPRDSHGTPAGTGTRDRGVRGWARHRMPYHGNCLATFR